MKIQSMNFSIEVSGATLSEIADLEGKGFNVSEVERYDDVGGSNKKAWKCKAEVTGYGSSGNLKLAFDFVEETRKL